MIRLRTILRSHGCQVIVNGAITTLKHYLRRISFNSHFVHEYVSEIETNDDVSYEVKLRWNELVGVGLTGGCTSAFAAQ